MKTFLLLSCLAVSLSAQAPPFETLLDLQLGVSGAPQVILAPLEPIHGSVVFRRLPHTVSCPGGRSGEFELRKVNPSNRPPAVRERISMICTLIDSIAIDTISVYEIRNSYQQTFYMRLIGHVDKSVKVRITNAIPADAELSTAAPPAEPRTGFVFADLDKAMLDRNSALLDFGTVGVAMAHPAQPAACPTTERWDLDLRKYAPIPESHPISRQILPNCRAAETVDVDSQIVFVVHTAFQETYYLRLLQLSGSRLKARLDLREPTISLRKRIQPAPSLSLPSITAYRPDGRIETLKGKRGSPRQGPVPGRLPHRP